MPRRVAPGTSCAIEYKASDARSGVRSHGLSLLCEVWMLSDPTIVVSVVILSMAFALEPSPAHAYEPALTDSNTPVSWDAGKVSFHPVINPQSSLRYLDNRHAVEASFTSWSDRSAIELVKGGQLTHDVVGYQPSETNHNTVSWQDGTWDYDPTALAVTLVTFDSHTGTLLDADIVINGVGVEWSTDGSPDRYDLQNALTHEVGHFIGLNHSDVDGATMRPSTARGETHKRTLARDDVAGKHFLYDRREPSDDEELQAVEHQSGALPGCTTGGSSRRSAWGALMLMIPLLVRTTRRQR